MALTRDTYIDDEVPTGPVSIADGADIALGAKGDAAAATDTGEFSLIALVKRLLAKFTTGITVTVADGADAALGAKADAVAGTDTGTFSLVALWKRALQRLTSILAGVGATDDAAAGSDAANASGIALTKRANQVRTSILTGIGAQADTAATTDGGTFSLIALVKRGLATATTFSVSIGATSDAAATTDAGTFSLIALTKRLLQKLTTGVLISVPQASVSTSFNGGVTTAVAKAAAGNLIAFNVANYAGSTRFLQFFDRTTAPTAGLVPTRQFPVTLGAASAPTVFAYGREFFGDSGLAFATGIVWAISTTNGTYTAATVGDCDVQVHYL
ncbi:MAG: hypothetical protein ACO1SV_27700 [Fimbriimonas sp.]